MGFRGAKSLYLLACIAAAMAAPLACKTSENDAYPCKLTVTSDLVVYLAVDTATDELAVEMTYTGGDSWLGFAVASSAAGKMGGADAVVGDARAVTSPITRYLLPEEAYPFQTLGGVTDAAVESAAGNTGTTLSFRRPLVAGGSANGGVSVGAGVNTFLYAIGNPGEGFGIHYLADSYQVQYSDLVIAATPTAAPMPKPTVRPVATATNSPVPGATTAPTRKAHRTPAPAGDDDSGDSDGGDNEATPTPTSAPGAGDSSPAPTAAGGVSACAAPTYVRTVSLPSSMDISWTVDVDAATVSVTLTYMGDAWLAWGPSPDSKMTGSDVIIGLPDAGTVSEYYISAKSNSGINEYPDQELTNTSIVQQNGVTTVAFTRLLIPAGAGKIALPLTGDFSSVWAHGFGNSLSQHPTSAADSVSFGLTTCAADGGATTSGGGGGGENTDELRTAHAWVMALTLGFFLPVGAIAARFGQRFQKGWWFSAHRSLQVLAVLGGIAGVIPGVVYVEKEYDGQHLNNRHAKCGVAIIVLVLVQAVFGALRPHLRPAAPVAKPVTAATTGTMAAVTVYPTDSALEAGVGSGGGGAGAPGAPQATATRRAWEVCHVVFGWGLIVWCVVQCFSGFRLLEKLRISDKYRTLYMVAVLVLLAVAVVLQLALLTRWMKTRQERRQPPIAAAAARDNGGGGGATAVGSTGSGSDDGNRRAPAFEVPGGESPLRVGAVN